MATGKMYECETKRLFKEGDVKVSRWIDRRVAEVSKGDAVRCKHCHGAVLIHQQNVDHGPADHVVHMEREDSENCQGGHYFPTDGVHKMSTRPVK